MTTENLIIIGSGPAGLTAAIYAARARLNPLVIDGSQPGGQLMGTTFIENWPGEERILGVELMANMRKHAESLGTRFLAEEITHTTLSGTLKTLTTKKGSTLQARAIIIATGATPKRLNCPGEAEYWGKGVTSCAVCDGAFYRDKKVLIIGGGDTAMEDASFMTNFTNDITIVHILDKLTASPAMQERVLNNPAIKIIYQTTVSAFQGNGSHVTHAVLTNQKTGEQRSEAFDGVFVAIGLNPNTKICSQELELHPSGHIKQLQGTQTSIPGVFAAGDVADMKYRQAITSAGDGCKAALEAEQYLKNIMTR